MMTGRFYECVALHVTLQASGSLWSEYFLPQLALRMLRREKGEGKTIFMDQGMSHWFGFVDSDLVKSPPQCYLHLGQMLFTFSFDYLEKEKKKGL